MAFDTPGRTERFLSKPSRSAGIDTSLVGSPQAHDNARLPPRWGRRRCAVQGGGDEGARDREGAPARSAGGGWRKRSHRWHAASRSGDDIPPAGRTCGVPAEKRHDVEGGGAWAGTARLTGGADDGVVFASHKTSIGDGNPEDRRGEGGAGGVAMAPRLRVDGPGEAPACGALGSGHPAWRMSSLQRAREMGESAVTGTQQWSLEGCQVGRSYERLLPTGALDFLFRFRYIRQLIPGRRWWKGQRRQYQTAEP